MRRARLRFCGRSVEFVDRDVAIRAIAELGERGTRFPVVIYGPEGCGKTALFKQVVEVLRELDYAVIRINPLAERIDERFSVSEELREFVGELGAYLLGDVYRLLEKAVEVLYTAVRRGVRRRIAILADDIFQAVGLDKAEQLVKSLLNMVEHSSADYDKVVVIVSSSEGITREKIGRHDWASIRILWNMSRKGFEDLYRLLPNPKPPLDDVWRLTGGNPRMLERLYEYDWSTEAVIEEIISGRALTASFIARWRRYLEEAVEDPDHLWTGPEEVEKLVRQLVERNLIVYHLPSRNPALWIDSPPPEKDLELGIGRYVAWQTPIHREAIRKALR